MVRDLAIQCVLHRSGKLSCMMSVRVWLINVFLCVILQKSLDRILFAFEMRFERFVLHCGPISALAFCSVILDARLRLLRTPNPNSSPMPDSGAVVRGLAATVSRYPYYLPSALFAGDGSRFGASGAVVGGFERPFRYAADADVEHDVAGCRCSIRAHGSHDCSAHLATVVFWRRRDHAGPRCGAGGKARVGA